MACARHRHRHLCEFSFPAKRGLGAGLEAQALGTEVGGGGHLKEKQVSLKNSSWQPGSPSPGNLRLWSY